MSIAIDYYYSYMFILQYDNFFFKIQKKLLDKLKKYDIITYILKGR